jgi:hypothetical protein
LRVEGFAVGVSWFRVRVADFGLRLRVQSSGIRVRVAGFRV